MTGVCRHGCPSASACQGACAPAAADPPVERVADFIRAYRLAGGDVSAMQAAFLAAVEGATLQDYAAGLVRANGAELGA